MNKNSLPYLFTPAATTLHFIVVKIQHVLNLDFIRPLNKVFLDGAVEENRTLDLTLTKGALYH